MDRTNVIDLPAPMIYSLAIAGRKRTELEITASLLSLFSHYPSGQAGACSDPTHYITPRTTSLPSLVKAINCSMHVPLHAVLEVDPISSGKEY